MSKHTKCRRCDDTGCPVCDPEWAQHQVAEPHAAPAEPTEVERAIGYDQSGEVASAKDVATSGGTEQQPERTGPTSPDPDDLVAQIRAFLADAPKGLPHEKYRYGELLAQAAAHIEADRERIAELGKANDQLFALGKSNYERAERAEASGKAWEIMCGGKQKIIEKLERERDEAVDDRERLTDNVCAVVQENEQLRINAERAEAENAKLRRVVEAADAMRRGEDCPICDSGKLRNPTKLHWDSCAFNNFDAARADLEKP